VNESLDLLSKNLASGMSRRKALWQFVSGLGALGFLTGRKAKADSGLVCEIWCNTQKTLFLDACLNVLASNLERQIICNAAATVFLAACTTNSNKCQVGKCAEFESGGLNDTSGVFTKSTMYTSFEAEEGDWVCVSVTGGGGGGLL
jgi:hypothetical protein